MKKIISLLLAAVLLSCGTISAFATTNTMVSNGNSQTDITYSASSAGGTDSTGWTVTVPAALAVGEEYTVAVSGTWAPYNTLSVTADSQVNMYLNGNTAADYAALPVTYAPIALAGSYDGPVSHTEAITVDREHQMNSIKYGIWEGTLTFYIGLEAEEGYSYGVIKGADLCSHQWGPSANLGDGRHFRTCQICGTAEYAAHVYAPTGSQARTCICGETFTLDAGAANFAVPAGDGTGTAYADLGAAIATASETGAPVVILEDMAETYDLTQAAYSSSAPVAIDPNGKRTLLHYGNAEDIRLLADYHAEDILAPGSAITIAEDGAVLTVSFESAADSSTLLVPAMAQSQSSAVMSVYTKQGLEMLAGNVNSGNSYAGWSIRQRRDIDLKNENWTPIGQSKAFSGSFDGGGHKISNLKIDSAAGPLGLFGKVAPSGAASIQNIWLENIDVFGTKTNVAGLIGETISGNSTPTGNHLILRNITITGRVTIEGYCGVAAIMCAGNVAEISNIVINASEGSYVSNAKHGTSSTWNLVASVKSFGNVSKVDNIVSNLDVRGKNIGVGGLFAILQGTSTISNLSYSGTVTLTASTANTTKGKGYYQHSGLLIGAPRFTIIADESTCTSTGKLVLNVDGEVKNSNDMAELFTWGGDLFGASRDADYTNKSYSLTYTG